MSIGDTLTTTGGTVYASIATPNPMETVFEHTDANGLHHIIRVSQTATKTRKRSVMRLDWDNVNTTTNQRESASVYIVGDRPALPGIFDAATLDQMLRSFLLNVKTTAISTKVFGGQV